MFISRFTAWLGEEIQHWMFLPWLLLQKSWHKRTVYGVKSHLWRYKVPGAPWQTPSRSCYILHEPPSQFSEFFWMCPFVIFLSCCRGWIMGSCTIIMHSKLSKYQCCKSVYNSEKVLSEVTSSMDRVQQSAICWQDKNRTKIALFTFEHTPWVGHPNFFYVLYMVEK